jgi:DNA-binding PadR family transcriptional regulator
LSIRHGLLGLLSQSPMHGYQLRNEFEAATGAAWPLGYPEPGDDRRPYGLTDRGAADLQQWFADPVPRAEPPRSELVIKVALSLLLPDVDTQAVIDVQRRATMAGLQGLIRAKAEAGGDLAASLVADAAIFNAEAEIRWLDHCETGLRSGKGAVT